MPSAKARGDANTAILFLDQLYPFPKNELRAEIARHPGAREIVWVQEEPANMGALSYVLPRLRTYFPDTALAAQVADLRGQVAQVNQRLDRAGLRGDLDLVARFEELARSVADTLDAAAPRGSTAPSGSAWTSRHTWPSWPSCGAGPSTVLRQHYSGYELRDCWPCHLHAVWELSTLAAAWHHAYGGQRPDLARALEFYDRWLPSTMRRVAHITRACDPDCVTRRRRSW